MRFVRLLSACVLAGALIACNTVAGVGKDLERAGEAIQGAVKR